MAIVLRQSGELIYLADEEIPVPHAFTTRFGGVSEGIFASLNLGQNLGDDPVLVSENYDRIAKVLETTRDRLVFSRQMHGDRVRVVGQTDCKRPCHGAADEEADGLVTADAGVTLAVFTADCIPILLWDAGTGAVGAVHAGWRSTAQNIAGKAVQKMIDFGAVPGQIRAAIGPGIGRCCFETGPEVPQAIDRVLDDTGAHEAPPYKTKSNGKAMVDLKEVNRCLLLRAGLSPERITVAAQCTMCAHEMFWSHRMTGGARGSQAAMIRM